MSLFPITRMSIFNPVSDFDRLFDTFLDETYPARRDSIGRSDVAMATIPRANVLEEKNGYSIELAAPGFSRGDFNIEVNDNMLTVSVSSEDTPEYASALKRREYSYTSFTRSWNLPETVSVNMIDATYSAGILTVNIPMEAKSAKKLQIEVKY